MNRIAIVEDDQGYRDTLFIYIKNVSGINLFDAGSRLDHHRFASSVLHQLHGTIHLIGKIQVLDRL